MVCNLEVDVNGEEIFFVDKDILSSFCGRLRKLFAKLSVMETTKTLKVVLLELPGGAEAFEIISKFCYNNGGIQLTTNNTCLAHLAAYFLEMAEITKETEKSLESISYWKWSEVINALKQCQDFVSIASSAGILDRLLHSLVRRIATLSDCSGSSPESSAFRFSFDTKGTLSTKINHCRSWWFEDLTCLNSQIIEKAIKKMITQKLDNGAISRFLFYYLKVSLFNSTPEGKKKVTETIVDLLYSLDQSSVPCKKLFGILRVSSSQNLSSLCRIRLETMIGAQIDQVVLDNLLVPSPPGPESLYDVDLVLRFVGFFLDSEGRVEIARLKKVGCLIDKYLTEVAPDSGLEPLKFQELVTALPDVARVSHDSLYRAIDMYLQVHTRLSEEEKMKICCAINHEKLSSESCKHLVQNSKFPSRTAILALITQHSKLKSLLKDVNNLGVHSGEVKQSANSEQIILCAKRVDLSVENQKLLRNLEGMQWRVKELERLCMKMQTQMTKMRKTKKLSRHSSSKSLPRMCS